MLFVTCTDGKLDGYAAAAAGMAFCQEKRIPTDVLITSQNKIARDLWRLLRALDPQTRVAPPVPEDQDADDLSGLLPALAPTAVKAQGIFQGALPTLVICGISPKSCGQQLPPLLDALAAAKVAVCWLQPWRGKDLPPTPLPQTAILEGHCDCRVVSIGTPNHEFFFFPAMVQALGMDKLERVKFLCDVLVEGPKTDALFKEHEAAVAQALKEGKNKDALPKPPELSMAQQHYLTARSAQKRYFLFADREASPAAVRKLAGIATLTPEASELKDHKLDPQFLRRVRIYNGKSKIVKELRRQLGKFAPTEARVMILGETGSGKDIAAEALHYGSKRGDKPFMPINCAEFINEGMLSGQIFGYKKGAFTGADKDTPGIVEKAEGGTLFLDEIGEMPLACQALLLRFLQNSEYNRLGESEITRKANVRVLCATNRDLVREVREGHFRADLYFRLKEVVVWVPPLRARLEDITDLANQRLEKLWEKNGWKDKGPAPKLTDEQAAPLRAYNWPGNIRELHGVVASALYDLMPIPEGFGHDKEVRARFIDALANRLPKVLAKESALGLLPGAGSEAVPLPHDGTAAIVKSVAVPADAGQAAGPGIPDAAEIPDVPAPIPSTPAPAGAQGDQISIYADAAKKRLKTDDEIRAEFVRLAYRACGENNRRTHDAIGMAENTIRKYLTLDEPPAAAKPAPAKPSPAPKAAPTVATKPVAAKPAPPKPQPHKAAAPKRPGSAGNKRK